MQKQTEGYIMREGKVWEVKGMKRDRISATKMCN